ncbi:MAG: RnfABCDGE type electron transport complex subunit G [Clostridia bacterium]|nr:RnfABCDGE type electron transport complex subunit G [Clostridia bacterium]
MNKIVKLALVLFAFSAIVALLLGMVNVVTEGRIAALEKEKQEMAMQEVLPSSGYEELTYTGGNPNVLNVYKAGDAGYVVKVVESGSQGNVEMIVGLDKSFVVTGVSIVKHSETSGLGAVAASTGADGQAFRDQFIGLTSANVVKDGGTVEAITGATITSRAVCRGVNDAIAAAKTVG